MLACSSDICVFDAGEVLYGGGGGILTWPYKRTKMASDGTGSSGKSFRNNPLRLSRTLLSPSFDWSVTVSFGIKRFDRRRSVGRGVDPSLDTILFAYLLEKELMSTAGSDRLRSVWSFSPDDAPALDGRWGEDE